MKVGDLVRDKLVPTEYAVILRRNEHDDVNAYRVLYRWGELGYESKDYIENDCEVISESR